MSVRPLSECGSRSDTCSGKVTRCRELTAGIMPDSFTSTLKKRLQEKAPELGDLCHSGFLLHWGYCTPFSATDAVYAITALLESHSIRSGSRIVTPRDAFWCASIKSVKNPRKPRSPFRRHRPVPLVAMLS